MTAPMDHPAIDDPRLVAALDLLRRTGAKEIDLRYCEDDEPVVWIVVGHWKDRCEATGALNPLKAVFRLCEETIDGGQCRRCNRPTGFDASGDPMPESNLICWYQYDPSMKTFTRGCTK